MLSLDYNGLCAEALRTTSEAASEFAETAFDTGEHEGMRFLHLN